MNNVFIIAEAGVNHNGSIEVAKKLVDFAVDAGADAIKFQTFKAENFVTKYALKAEYQKHTAEKEESQYEMIKKLELDKKSHIELINYCKNKIMFLSSPFDVESINLLSNLDLSIFKIPSGEINNLPYLRCLGMLNKKLILSTGMSSLEEIQDALNILIAAGTPKENISILHATTEYPCPIDEVNLYAMLTIKYFFNVKVGYSDHTKGIEVPIAAVALGASIIEKHFTLNRNMEGPDHQSSLEPGEFKVMVKAIRNIQKSLGSGIKEPTKSEKKNIYIVRKSIVASRNIKYGETFSKENLTVKRPGYGISPMKWDDVLGCKASRDFIADELIEL